VLTAGYFLWLLQRINLGNPLPKWADEPLDDVMRVEWVSWTPLLILIIALGIFPVLIFGVQDAAVANLMGYLTG
jgi:NADH:ubiquinone oxidoreductase subunit 4 (subunit M)